MCLFTGHTGAHYDADYNHYYGAHYANNGSTHAQLEYNATSHDGYTQHQQEAGPQEQSGAELQQGAGPQQLPQLGPAMQPHNGNAAAPVTSQSRSGPFDPRDVVQSTNINKL